MTKLEYLITTPKHNERAIPAIHFYVGYTRNGQNLAAKFKVVVNKNGHAKIVRDKK